MPEIDSIECQKQEKIRTRDDGRLDGVYGPCNGHHDRKSIAGRMGWEDGGKAVAIITNTLALLRDGKAVELKSHAGYCVFQPLTPEEDGTKIPASAKEIYNWEGKVIRRIISET